ncbi:invasion associated locus B family protein [Candidatus Phyllobacterium onerii]|uniref:invasion associated locus B family protein n=1 Tax=Candidatus Phyllobacterium onerii TaxID=3020828 RepID=UPI00232A8631|nr:invasion associated locus B family protein [Phyllobacterium sp. IY22]
MIRQALKRPISLACLLLSGLPCPPAAGQELSNSGYSIKPSEVRVPQGVELGRYRRTIQPFENWELRCDENLKAKKKICNITQTILDGEGGLAFSWSLAATEGGKPIMVLRTRPGLGTNKPVTLKFPGRDAPVIAETYACDANVCVTYLPVGPVLREQIAKEANVQLSYKDTAETTLIFEAPLKGLSVALAAIK